MTDMEHAIDRLNEIQARVDQATEGLDQDPILCMVCPLSMNSQS